MAFKTWTVVQFEDNNTVEAVPTSWIQGDICHWPKGHPKLIKYIKQSEPLNTCWPTHRIKVFRNATFDDYLKARQKARIAEETSDLASEMESGHNKRKRIQKVISSSDDSIEESLLPSPPKRRMVNEKNLESNTVGDQLDKSNIPSETSCIPMDSNRTQQDYCCKGCQQNANKLKTVIEQNHLLRNLITDVLLEVRLTREVQAIGKGTEFDKSLFIKYKLDFPLNKEEDFMKFEDILNNESNFNEALNEIARVGGTNNYNMVKRILSSLLTNEEAMKYSWLGRKGKRPFSNLKVTQLIISAVEKANMAKTRKETELSIQAWLKGAKERKDVNSTKKF